jgi:ketosteroid isomerase-like protein
MPHPATPTEVFHALADGVPRLLLGDDTQLDRLVGLYADRTEVVHPFAPQIAPLRSPDELRRHFTQATRMTGAETFAAVDRVVHRTTDPEVVVGEFRYVGRVRGRPLDVPCIFVLRVRDGKIVESHDYAGHARMAAAFAGASSSDSSQPT